MVNGYDYIKIIWVLINVFKMWLWYKIVMVWIFKFCNMINKLYIYKFLFRLFFLVMEKKMYIKWL